MGWYCGGLHTLSASPKLKYGNLQINEKEYLSLQCDFNP